MKQIHVVYLGKVGIIIVVARECGGLEADIPVPRHCQDVRPSVLGQIKECPQNSIASS